MRSILYPYASTAISRQHERGSTIPLIALSFTVLSGIVGLSIDTARAQLVQSKLSAALDAAGLAAGSSVSTTNLLAEVQKYMNANYPAGANGATVTKITATPNSDNTKIALSATAAMDNTFMKIFGMNQQTLVANTEITRSSKGLELVLVLDNTGSMSGSMTTLRNAANQLLTTLYGTRTTVPNLWVGLVPFSQTVNVGSNRTSWLDSTHYATLNWGTTSWMGCVDADLNNFDTTDNPPTVQKQRAYFWPKDTNNAWSKRTLDATDGPNKYCPSTIVPLTANKSTVQAGITAMVARGNTQVNFGAVWGWRMLSPRWRNQWGGEMDTNSLPLEYNTKNMNKAVVLMTDGENTIDNTARTSYGYLSDGRLGTTNGTTAVSRLNTRLADVCTAMKNSNIYVYTIAFNNPGTTIQNLLRSCATSPDYYFNSPTSTSLTAAFSAIGDSLANLRVSK
jgi:Flp pilus assembly protein TadG